MITGTMHSIICKEAGIAEGNQIVECSIPKPKANQVQINVKAVALSVSDFNPFLEKENNGKVSYLTRLMAQNKAFGGDISGIVTGVGENVSSLKIGDEVYASIGINGGSSEYVVANANKVFLKPHNLSFEEAAALPTAGIVAMEACKKAKIHSGMEVLIQGASGGVGQLALQIAKAMGANITAVCSTRNVDNAYSMGAERVIDYKKENVSECGCNFDAILGVNGNVPLATYKKLLKQGGTYIAIGGGQATAGLIAPLYALGSGKKMTFVMYASAVYHRHLKTLAHLAEQGKIKPMIEGVYRPNELGSTLEMIGKNHAQGKVVLVPNFKDTNAS